MRDITDDLRLRFIAAAACWSAGLLLLLRSPSGERLIVGSFVGWQAALASRGSVASPVTVDASCSAGDVIALSAAVMLAYPVAWRRRLWGLGMGALWLVALNLLRIVTLVNTAGTPLFMPLHLYVWPAILIAAATAFVFTWMWLAERGTRDRVDRVRRWRNLTVVTVVLVTGYVIAAPLLLGAEVVQRAAMMMAAGAAMALGALGVDALTVGSTLVVRDTSFLITSECIVSPLMPVYLAWAFTWPSRMRTKVLALALFLPMFIALGFVRLLTVAMPGLIGPPLFLTHGFYQLLLGALIVLGTTRAGAVATGGTAMRRVAAAVLATVLAVAVAPAYSASIVAAGQAVRAALASAPPSLAPDLQGAVAILPAYQLALLWSLSAAWFGARAWRPLIVLTPIAAGVQIAVVGLSGAAATSSIAEAPALVRALSVAIPCALVVIAALGQRRNATAAGVRAELRA